ncbi:MAG: hypothetical protein ACPLSY_03735 [Moorellaceae bacterium]
MNPFYGKWPTDNDIPDPLAEAIDWDAQAEFHRVLARLSTPARSHTRPSREKGEKRRLAVRIRAKGAVAVMGDGLYSRPFTKEEAGALLGAAGIRHEGVERTYLAPRSAVCDPCSGRGPDVAQGVVVRIRTVEGRGVRNVHLFFRYDVQREGWRLIRAAVEVPL